MADTKKRSPNVKDLSQRMFWDTSIEDIDWYEHRAFIVERVMTYGQLSDWKLIRQWYSEEELKSIVTSIRNLDGPSVAYLSLVLNLKKEDFRCYIERQSRPNSWNAWIE